MPVSVDCFIIHGGEWVNGRGVHIQMNTSKDRNPRHTCAVEEQTRKDTYCMIPLVRNSVTGAGCGHCVMGPGFLFQLIKMF